ncbi:MAG: hypothetical protein ACK49V_01970, partial [Actinomycetes bacterium]
MNTGAKRVMLTVDTGDDATELRQSDSIIYVNVGQLGGPGPMWVSLDAARQSSEFATKSVRSFLRSHSPEFLLMSLSSASNIEKVAADSNGTHF